MKVNQTIKSKIQLLRKSKQLSQRDMAKAIGITPVTYQLYEYGVREPRVSTAIKLAKALGKPVEEIWNT